MFKDYVVLVTGAASGIGLGTATQFIENHAAVVAVDYDEKTLTAAAAKMGNDYHARLCDISKKDQVVGVAKYVEDTFGKLDVLVNNAATAQIAAVEHMREEDYYYHYEVNVKGTMLMVTHCLPLLRKSSHASIVNISSTAGVVEHANHHFLYSTSKAAVLKYTRHLTRDLRGIRANTILPGWVDTPIYERSGAPRELVEEIFQKALKTIPVGRIAKPEDIANVILFLSSEKASYVNGATINVDGGLTTSADWAWPF
jgi:NAD(P)-dependent dehydrogenase (short-subunit alcohol dehydrogenase family)